MKIKLEMDLERAILLMHACETMARIGMGQFKAMVDLLRPDFNWDQGWDIERFLKERIFPEMSPQGYNGIKCKEVNESTQVAWDAYQHIRREISWFDAGKDFRKDQRDWKTMMTVNFDDPMKASKLAGDFKTERLEDNEDI